MTRKDITNLKTAVSLRGGRTKKESEMRQLFSWVIKQSRKQGESPEWTDRVAKRGELTKEVQNLALKHIGRKISVEELRLIPYVCYVMVNEKEIDYHKVSEQENEILNRWRDSEYIDGSIPVTMTKDFWDFCCEVLYAAYVDVD